MRAMIILCIGLAASLAVVAGEAIAEDQNYRAQLAALQHRDGIGAEWRRLDGAYADLLGALDRYTVPVARDGQNTVYRLQVGPLSVSGARTLCGAIRERGQDCLIARAPAAPQGSIPTLSVRRGPGLNQQPALAPDISPKQNKNESLAGAMEAFNQGRLQQAVQLFGPLADGGNPIAQNFLGILYGHGQGVPADPETAVGWYLKAAEQGYAAAQHNLGDAYEHGAGVAQDLALAARWYRAAAKQDVASAQNALAGLYYRGEGVRRDLQEAVHWYIKAAQAGYAESQHNLGVLYFKGEGVRQDNIAAHTWWSLAARTSDPVDDLRQEAADNAARLESYLSPEELSDSRRRVAQWMAEHL